MSNWIFVLTFSEFSMERNFNLEMMLMNIWVLMSVFMYGPNILKKINGII